MKALISTLVFWTLALCEVPPPYPRGVFKPSPPYPQAQFRPPTQQITTLDVTIPAKLTIEQLIRLTEQLQNSRRKVVNRFEKTEAGLFRDSYLPPQQTYGPPSKPQPNNPQKQKIPLNSYGVPIVQSSNNKLRPLSTSYGVPDTRNIETFGEQQREEAILRQNLLNDLKKQQLPYYKSPAGFRPQGSQNVQSQSQPSVSQQYLPASAGGSVGQQTLNGNKGNPNLSNSSPNNNVGQGYLPPATTTTKSIFIPQVTTVRPTTAATTLTSVEGATNYDYDYDQQPTESPSSQDGFEAGPNISISNAVAGASGVFYLQQPDGRLQRVALQKIQEPNSKQEEYVANYYFQNIQALPNAVYTPLITLGSYTKK